MHTRGGGIRKEGEGVIQQDPPTGTIKKLFLLKIQKHPKIGHHNIIPLQPRILKK